MGNDINGEHSIEGTFSVIVLHKPADKFVHFDRFG